MLTALDCWEARHRKFFEILREPRRWLNNEVCKFPFIVSRTGKYDDCFVTIITSSQHIEAAMDMLRRRLSVRPSMFRNTRIDFIGPYFASIISRNLQVCLNRKLEYHKKWKKYFYGESSSPGYFKRKWVEDVDQLYMVVNVQDIHWVAALIDLNLRSFTIWDPCFDLYSDETIEKAAWPYAVCLPYMLALREGSKYRQYPFEIKRVEKQFVPQNLQTGDCGVYSIKYIEDHARWNGFSPDLCDNNIKSIRDRLEVDIFYEVDVREYPRETKKCYAGT